MSILVTVLLMIFGMPQATAPTQNGSIEGRVFRASNNEPISGVQITLIPPVPAASSTAAPATTGGAVPPPPPPQAAPATPQAIQVIRTADGGVQVIQAGTGANPVPANLPPELLAQLLNAA